MKRTAFIITAALFFFATTASAQTTTPVESLPSIVVEGNAELKAVPDEFVITVGAESQDSDLDDVLKDNETRVKALLKAASDHGIERKYIITSGISIQPDVDYQSGKIQGYRASKTVTIIVYKVEKLEPLMRALLEKGANRVNGIQFRTKNIQSLRDQARLEAVKNAREKAKAMTDALGETLGRALVIEESFPNYNSGGNFVYTQDTPDAGETISIGKIRVQATVRIRFELK